MRYTGQDITISLNDRPDPGDDRLTINDIGTFTIWCQRFGVFFSVLEIPKGLMLSSTVRIPSYMHVHMYIILYLKMQAPVLQYCAQLTTNFQVSWTVDVDSDIATFELCSCVGSG